MREGEGEREREIEIGRERGREGGREGGEREREGERGRGREGEEEGEGERRGGGERGRGREKGKLLILHSTLLYLHTYTAVPSLLKALNAVFLLLDSDYQTLVQWLYLSLYLAVQYSAR